MGASAPSLIAPGGNDAGPKGRITLAVTIRRGVMMDGAGALGGRAGGRAQGWQREERERVRPAGGAAWAAAVT